MKRKSQKKKRTRTPKPVLYIAIVVNSAGAYDEENMNVILSARNLGDWASFIGFNEADVIARAKTAMDQWNAGSQTYVMLTGMINGRAHFPSNYTIQRF